MNASVQNVGDAETSDTVSLVVDGEIVDEAAVSLAAGEQTTVSLGYETVVGDADSVALTVRTSDDEQTVSVDVFEAGAAAGTATFVPEILETNQPRAGDLVELTAEIENVGNATGTQQVEFGVNTGDGTFEAVEESTLELESTESIQLKFEYDSGEGDAPSIRVRVSTESDEAERLVTLGEPDEDSDGGNTNPGTGEGSDVGTGEDDEEGDGASDEDIDDGTGGDTDDDSAGEQATDDEEKSASDAASGDEAVEDNCELFGFDFGKFIVCWYWWVLLVPLVLIALLLLRRRNEDNESYEN